MSSAPSLLSSAQTEIQSELDKLVKTGRETGLQVAAYLDGQLVIDAWAGLADSKSGAPVTADTLFLGYSCSKGVTSTLIQALLAPDIGLTFV